MSCNQEKNQSIEAESEMAGMIELADKYLKVRIINMFKDLITQKEAKWKL